MNTPLIFPSKVLDQHVVVLGKTGSGKSSALRYMVEYLLDRKKRVCIIDPKGDWHGIKIASDGTHPGYPVIAFGSFKDERATDVPINPQAFGIGKQVAELIAKGNRPCVIGFRGWMQGEMTRFWIDFASTLFKLNEGDLTLVIDEVHNFAAKGKIMDVDAGKCLHWTNRLMAEGRGLGITALIASQRPQKVHNDTLTSCETLVAMRVIHEADRAALKEWIDGCGDKTQGKIVLDAVAQMPRGDAYMWSPEIGFGPVRIHFPMFRTFDSFAPPQLQKAIAESGWGDVDIEDVKAKLAVVIEESKANDPRELKKTIAELRKQIATPIMEAVIERQEVRVEVPVLKEGQLTKATLIADKLGASIEKLKNMLEVATTSHTTLTEALAKVNANVPLHPRPNPLARYPRTLTDFETIAFLREKGEQARQRAMVKEVQRAMTAPPVATIANAVVRAEPKSVNIGDTPLTNPEQRILNSLAWFESIRRQDVENVACAFIAGYTLNGSYYNARGKLNGKGLVNYLPNDRVCLTPEGRARADFPADAATVEALHAQVMAKLSGPEQRVLKPLLDSYPEAMGNDDLAHKAGYTLNGSFYNARGKLRTLGLIEYPAPNRCVARPLLFLET